jgi:hypothetical protein
LGLESLFQSTPKLHGGKLTKAKMDGKKQG